MLMLKINRPLSLRRIEFTLKLLLQLFNYNINAINRRNLIEQIIVVGPESLGILIITASFIGIVFTLQVVKEFLYLNASSFVGAILSIAFIRELSPVLTAIILIGRISSSFTAELATMKVTEQIDALYLLRVDPLTYLVLPRLVSCLLMLPCLNIIFLFTSLSSSIFTCFIFYNIHPRSFLYSSLIALSFNNIIKSTCKSIVFSFIVSIISCAWGLTTDNGSKSVGQATTSSVVTSLLMVFISDCILTYVLFGQSGSVIKSL